MLWLIFNSGMIEFNIHVNYFSIMYNLLLQSNLSILDTLGPSKTVLIIEVSLFQRSIYIVVGAQLTVLIIEVSLFQSVHNSRFDCNERLS